MYQTGRINIDFKDSGKNQLFVRSMGKMLRVVAAFTSIDAANNYCEKHKDEGVVAEIEKTILIANLYDKGLKI